MRPPLPKMIDVAELFPKAEQRPFTVHDAWEKINIPADDLDYATKIVEHRKNSICIWLTKTPQGKQLSDLEPRGYFFNWVRLAFNSISPSVPKEDTNLCHPTEFRALTFTECKRLMSYPDRFKFAGSPHQKRACIGNSVPPLFMRAIALQIRSKVFDTATELPMSNPRNKYLDILDAAWQQHLAPRAENAPTVISTFAGAGGSSLGYSMAGYRELLAVEWDNNAVETFKLNFPDIPVYHGDIAKLSVEQCMDMAGVAAGELDVLDGSPPCQGFSTAGKRVLDDPRNQLYHEYVRLLRGLQPKVFVMENVSGMVKGKMKLVFAECIRELKASGYQVKACLINAMYFNVPQSRQRMIFIGIRDDLGIAPSHPRAAGRPFTVQDAIGDIKLSDSDIKETQLTDLYKSYWHSASYGQTVGMLNQNIKLHPDRPSKTLQKGEGNGGVYHPFECRSLSQIEMARLGSFHERFCFIGGKRFAKDRIGNSVPPLFMRSIAAHIREHILEQVE